LGVIDGWLVVPSAWLAVGRASPAVIGELEAVITRHRREESDGHALKRGWHARPAADLARETARHAAGAGAQVVSIAPLGRKTAHLAVSRAPPRRRAPDLAVRIPSARLRTPSRSRRSRSQGVMGVLVRVIPRLRAAIGRPARGIGGAPRVRGEPHRRRSGRRGLPSGEHALRAPRRRVSTEVQRVGLAEGALGAGSPRPLVGLGGTGMLPHVLESHDLSDKATSPEKTTTVFASLDRLTG
jgi:hypothetical protein